MARSRRDMQRWGSRGTTAERGYHSKHQKLREQRLAVYRPGDICAHGGEQMWWWPLAVARRFLDLPHNADRSGYLPGLSCRRHNRGEGATRGNRMRGRVRAWRTSRSW
jgi:hypothetical protein